MNKLNILFSGEIFSNISESKTKRTGIYFAAINILKFLIKNPNTNVTLFLNRTSFKNKDALFKSMEISPIPVLLQGDNLSGYNAFISPIEAIPECIRQYPEISCYTILYDITPLLFNNYFEFANVDWFMKLVKTLNNLDYYFSISDNTKNDFLKYFPELYADNIKTIPISTNQDYKIDRDPNHLIKIKEKYNIPTDKKYLFSLCTLEPRKNLIRAVKNFITFIEKNNIDDLVFVLGGGAWDGFIEKFEKEVPEFEKYKDKIVKAGYVDDEDLGILYSNAEWFVYTSQYEGFGMPPLEAMKCGCPVITSNNSSLPEVVGDAGIMIDFDSDEQHVEAYEKYYFNNDYKNEMAQKGLERSKLFSWDKTVEIIINKIREVENKKAQKPLVTIITATYNLIDNGRKDWFIQNLESVRTQTYPNIEHIIIDGASTDGTLDLIKEYVDKGWVTCYSEPDKGIYDALNKGILKANGKYVVCLNSDDFYCDRHAVEWLVSKAEETDADACYGNATRVQPDSLETISKWNGNECFVPITDYFPCHQTFIIKTDVMKELGLYNSEYKVSADNRFFQRLLNFNKKFVSIDKDIIYFRDGGFSNYNLKLSDLERKKGYFEEYGQFHHLTPFDINSLMNDNFYKLSLDDAISLGVKLMYTNNPKMMKFYFSNLFNYHINSGLFCTRQAIMNLIFSKIFSIRTTYDKKRRIITILGIKIKQKYKQKQCEEV